LEGRHSGFKNAAKTEQGKGEGRRREKKNNGGGKKKNIFEKTKEQILVAAMNGTAPHMLEKNLKNKTRPVSISNPS